MIQKVQFHDGSGSQWSPGNLLLQYRTQFKMIWALWHGMQLAFLDLSTQSPLTSSISRTLGTEQQGSLDIFPFFGSFSENPGDNCTVYHRFAAVSF